MRNPDVDHPRWTQKTERRIGEGGLIARRRLTLPFNGYAEQVAGLYAEVLLMVTDRLATSRPRSEFRLPHVPQWTVYAVGLLPAVFYFHLGVTDQLGRRSAEGIGARAWDMGPPLPGCRSRDHAAAAIFRGQSVALSARHWAALVLLRSASSHHLRGA